MTEDEPTGRPDLTDPSGGADGSGLFGGADGSRLFGGSSSSGGTGSSDGADTTPYTAPSYARLRTSYEAYELAELARAAVPIAAHEQHPDDGTPVTAGAVLADAVRILTAAHRLVEAAVVYERLGGAP